MSDLFSFADLLVIVWGVPFILGAIIAKVLGPWMAYRAAKNAGTN